MYKHVVVGVSGGCDSMALLHSLYQQGIDVIAVHVNYHKRTTALRDQKAVEKLCYDLRVKLIVIDYDDQGSGNFQKDARDFRYMSMVHVAHRYNCEAIAVAHHYDDVLETYIIQMQSGRKSRVLGLKEKSKVLGMTVYRPFINKTKKELIAYCEEHGITYYDDESNFTYDYRRNEIRHALSKKSKTQLEQIEKEMNLKQAALDHYYSHVDEALQGISDSFPLEKYKQICDSYRLDVLRQWIWNQGVTDYSLSNSQLEDFDIKILNESLDEELGYKKLCTSYDSIVIFETISYSYQLHSVEAFETMYFKLDNVGSVIEGISLNKGDFPITIRTPQKGDKIKMRYGSKNVNRFFIDRKISHNLRHCWPLVENVDKEVIFVSGMGCDILHFSNIPSVFVVKL